jgi:hypothetical protein
MAGIFWVIDKKPKWKVPTSFGSKSSITAGRNDLTQILPTEAKPMIAVRCAAQVGDGL